MRLLTAILVGLCATSLPSLAAAQTKAASTSPKADVSIGVRHLADTDEYGLGVVMGASAFLGRFIAVVGEADLHRHTEQFSSTTTIESKQTAIVGGLRVFSPERRVRAFAHLLAGRVVTTRIVSTLPSGSGSVSKFTWQPGAGIDVEVARRIAARVQGDIREWGERPHLNYYKALRLTGSVVVRLGGRLPIADPLAIADCPIEDCPLPDSQIAHEPGISSALIGFKIQEYGLAGCPRRALL